MRYWWVNQNQTYRQEQAGGYLWSPKRNSNAARNPFLRDHARGLARRRGGTDHGPFAAPESIWPYKVVNFGYLGDIRYFNAF